MKKILCLTIALGLSGFVVGCGETTVEKKEVKTSTPAGTTTKTEETKTH